MEVFNNAGQAADMVAMRVRERNHIKMLQPARPQVGRNHVFAKIELTAHRSNAAAAVDQNGSSLGRNHQEGIALPHVNGGNFKLAAFDLRRGMIRGNNAAGKKQSCQSGKSHGPLLAYRYESQKDSCEGHKHEKSCGIWNSPLRYMEARKKMKGAQRPVQRTSGQHGSKLGKWQ